MLVVLDPDVELRADAAAVLPGIPQHVTGAEAVAAGPAPSVGVPGSPALCWWTGWPGSRWSPAATCPWPSRSRSRTARSPGSTGARIPSGSAGSPWPCWTTRAEGPASLARDVPQAYLPMSDEPAGLVRDADPPQLLGAALVEGDCFDAPPAGVHGPQEVGGVGEADGNLALIAHGAAGPDARRT